MFTTKGGLITIKQFHYYFLIRLLYTTAVMRKLLLLKFIALYCDHGHKQCDWCERISDFPPFCHLPFPLQSQVPTCTVPIKGYHMIISISRAR